MPSEKNIGKPYAGEPHVRFDEGGQARACSLLYHGTTHIICPEALQSMGADPVR